jgi:hypothetical protein
MKKIFTLALASLFTVALFATDRRPSVTLTTDKKFEVVIDGKSYGSAIGNSMLVSLNNNSRHTIKVYELKGGLFSKQRSLVGSTTFQLSRNDMNISVSRNGQISIREDRNNRFDDRDRYDQHDQHDQRGHRNDNKRF